MADYGPLLGPHEATGTIRDTMSFTDEPPDGAGSGRTTRFELLVRSAVALTTEHDPDRILAEVVRYAAQVANARYAALGVYDADGSIERFVHYGVDAETVARIGHYPEGRGLLGEVIVAEGAIRLADLTRDPRACGFPAHHPAMRSFLGVPVRVGSRRYGNLYLTDRLDGGGFDAQDEQLVATLAAFAAAAIEGTRLVAAQQGERARTEMLAQVIEAQEAERARVARDLHDEIGQALTSVLLGLRLVSGALATDPPDLAEVRRRSDELRQLVADALEEVRQLAFELRPTVLDDIGLVAALRRLVQETSDRHGLRVVLTLEGIDDDTRLSPDVETVVYRVVQEALTNVCRHAQAAQATVDLAATPEGLRLSVLDDGSGFDAAAVPPGSLGLTGMGERASLVGGSLEIVSTSGVGTRVVLEVPVG